VCCGDDFSGGSCVVIVEVIRDDSTTAHEVIVLVKKKTSERKLSWSRVGIISAGCHDGGLTSAAHFGGVTSSFTASLSPWNRILLAAGLLGIDADDPEHGQVDAGVVAAGLLTHGTRVLLAVGVSHGPVHDTRGDSSES